MDVFNKDLRQTEASMRFVQEQRDKRIGVHGLNIKIDNLIDLLNDTIKGSNKVADENISLQRSVKRLTAYIFWLTIGLSILAIFQIYYAHNSLLVSENSFQLQSSQSEQQKLQSPAPTNTNKIVPPADKQAPLVDEPIPPDQD
jgi:hypothetical protein